MQSTTESKQKRSDMTIKPIKSERDYQKALKQIEELWDVKRTQQRATGWRPDK